MMRRMLGAPLGGTTRAGQYGVDSRALSLITPPNFIGAGGSCFPSIVTVALGEPGTPVSCWAGAGSAMNIAAAMGVIVANFSSLGFIVQSFLFVELFWMFFF